MLKAVMLKTVMVARMPRPSVKRVSIPLVACVVGVAVPCFAASEESGAHPPYLISSTIWAIVSFLVVVAILLKTVFPKILAAMDSRAQEIRDGLDAAEKARAEAEEMMSRHQSDLAKAREEAAGIVTEAKSDAEKLAASIRQKANDEAEERSARAVRDIEQAKNTALDSIQRQAAALSIDIASELIKKNLNADDHKALIDERIASFRDL